MKKITILTILLFLSLFSIGQILNLENDTFDLNKLSFKNSYVVTEIDTVGISDSSKGALYEYRKTIFASINLKYFLIVYDTLCIGPIGIPTGCDSPRQTYFSLYNEEALIWTKKKQNSINGAYFFENKGSCIISWNDPWSDNYYHFYNENGYVIDTMFINNKIYSLTGDKIFVHDRFRNSDSLKCFNSENKVIWTGKKQFNNNVKFRNILVSGNGKSIIIESNDSVYSFNSNFNLIWSNARAESYYSLISKSGNYLKQYSVLYKNSNRVKYSMVDIFDKNSGEKICHFDSLLVDDKHINYYNSHFIANSDYLCMEYEDRVNEVLTIIFANIKGEIINYMTIPQPQGDPDLYYGNGNVRIFFKDSLYEEIKILNKP